jgi:hypothetical protein
VNLFDQPERQVRIALLSGNLREAQEVADGEGVGPQIAARGMRRDEPRALGVARHERCGALDGGLS